MEHDISYWFGGVFGPALIAVLIGYVVIRLTKKRNPHAKEWGIIILIAAIVFIFAAVARVAKTAY